MERIYIGLGSNLADPADQLRSAIAALAVIGVLIIGPPFAQAIGLLARAFT